jgi:hypothetical protein
MIHDVDQALRNMIDAEVTNGGGVEISFDAPTKDWSARRSAPTINVFLYDIREDLSRRDLGPQVVRDDRGIVIDRQPPPRRFKLSYLLTAWTQRAEDEHRLLSGLLSLFLQHDAVPQVHLAGSLADFGLPTLFSLALPPGPDRSLSDIWSALGGELKPSLELQVIAPFDPRRHFETGPPTLEAPRIRLGPDGADAAAALDGGAGQHGADRGDGDPPAGTRSRGRTRRARRTDAADDDAAKARSEGQDAPAGGELVSGRPGVRRAPAEPLEGTPGGERIQVGTDQAPGRTFVIRPSDR